jgi:hypothetical protein
MRTALAGFGLSLLAVVSHAQEPPHHGVWIGAGVGLAPHAGLGYDIGVAHELYLTPYVQYLRSIAGSHVNIDGEETSFSFHPNLIQAGLGVRWR